MIPCNHCGVENPLGTLFCRACGQRIEVDPHAIMGSVKQSAEEARESKLLQAGRSALAVSGFLLMAALIVNVVVIPELPQARMPQPDPLPGAELLPPPAQETAATTPELAVGAGASALIDWRRTNATHLIGSFGTDLERVLGWMQQVLDRQQPDGSFLGSDPLVATAVSVLALQAWPGDPAADRGAEKGRDWLYARRNRVLEGSDRRAQSLVAMALLESGRLQPQEVSTFAALIGSGAQTEWQALVLPLFPDERRPTELLVLRRDLESDPLWRHYLDRFTTEALVPGPDKTLFSAAGLIGLDPFQRWVWSQTAWFHAADPETYAATIRSWSASEQPPAAPEPLATLAGPQAGAALAILAVCAPARVPVVRADPPR